MREGLEMRGCREFRQAGIAAVIVRVPGVRTNASFLNHEKSDASDQRSKEAVQVQSW